MEELVVSAHEFESFSKWYRYREPVVSGCVQGVSSTRNIHLPVNTLKIDKSFIDRMFNDTTQNSIIKNIIDMSAIDTNTCVFHTDLPAIAFIKMG